ATGSWAGGVALALEIAVAAVVLEPQLRRWRWLGGATVFLALAFLVSIPRLRGLLEGSDTSWSAREAYLCAGWRGFLERPLLGWGPGSTPWTLAEFLEPLPGIHPPGGLVGDLHNLPLQLFYELGASGGAFSLILFALLLARSTSEARDRPLAVAAKLGWLGFGVASLGGAPLSVLALPMALAVVLGAWQAALPGPGFPRTPRVRRWFPWVVAGLCFLGLLPLRLAHHAYERASRSQEALPALETALRWDPTFPLYRARHAALAGDFREASVAARGAPAVAAHWLLAAGLAPEAAGEEARKDLLEACRLDPFNALPPYLLAVRSGGTEAAVEAAARALLAEPRLLAADLFRDSGFRRQVALRIRRQEGVEEGLRSRWTEVLDAPYGRSKEFGELSERPPARLSLGYDGRPELALSTFLFRRRPWPLEVAAVILDGELAAEIDLPPAPALASTASWVFSRKSCGLGETAEGSARSQ
ncbi:MAG: O-antigen ligase family protein, partial [Acidobacteria bacterium]|nr:O-antigen ligase family protein [Acidobacteriota bacterium]